MGLNFGGITVTRVVVNGNVVDYAGCETVDIGSGSGSGDCCDNGQDCPASECTQRFLSTGGEWSFTYEGVAYGGWVLRNLITGDIWVWSDISGPICALAGFAVFSQDGLDEIDMTPTSDCEVSSYNCTDGDCVGVSGTGGTYEDIEQCEANCGITYNCADGVCVEVFDGTGTYPTLLACQTACGGGGAGVSCVCCGEDVTNPAILFMSGCGSDCGPIEVPRSLFGGNGFTNTSVNCFGSTGQVQLVCSAPGGVPVTWNITISFSGSIIGAGGDLVQNGNTLTGTLTAEPLGGPCDIDIVAILPDGCWEACP